MVGNCGTGCVSEVLVQDSSTKHYRTAIESTNRKHYRTAIESSTGQQYKALQMSLTASTYLVHVFAYRSVCFWLLFLRQHSR